MGTSFSFAYFSYFTDISAARFERSPNISDDIFINSMLSSIIMIPHLCSFVVFHIFQMLFVCFWAKTEDFSVTRRHEIEVIRLFGIQRRLYRFYTR